MIKLNLSHVQGSFPDAIQKRPYWVVWKAVPRGERITKIPYQPNGSPAESDNPQTWSEFSTCVEAVRTGKWDGLGCMIRDPFIAVDFDHVRDPKTGKVEAWAVEAIKQLNSYTELSPSGEGFHVWCLGTIPGGAGKRRGRVEIYCNVRYFTVTGEWIAGKLGFDSPKQVNEIPQTFVTAMESLDPTSRVSDKAPLLSAASVTQSMKEKLVLLAQGRWEECGFTSQSDADMAYVRHLFEIYKGDEQRIREEFNRSGLAREKSLERTDYLSRTIKAVADNYKGGKALEVPKLVSWELREFLAAKIPPRRILAKLPNGTAILTAQSINQVFAWRGTGKTFFTLSWAVALAAGDNFLCYETHEPLRVLYIEGEMPDPQLQERLSGLTSGRVIKPDMFRLLSRDHQIQLGTDIPSLHTLEGRTAIEAQIEQHKPEVLIFDSMSSLLQLGTNDEDSWLDVLPWLSKLRSIGLCIIFLQQTGKNQELGSRGHSRSEDPLDLSIKLTPFDKESDTLDCKLEYTKIRAQRKGVRSLRVSYHGDWRGWKWAELEKALLEDLKKLLAMHPDLSNVKIADALGCSRNSVNKLKKKLEDLINAEVAEKTIGNPTDETVKEPEI